MEELRRGFSFRPTGHRHLNLTSIFLEISVPGTRCFEKIFKRLVEQGRVAWSKASNQYRSRTTAGFLAWQYGPAPATSSKQRARLLRAHQDSRSRCPGRKEKGLLCFLSITQLSLERLRLARLISTSQESEGNLSRVSRHLHPPDRRHKRAHLHVLRGVVITFGEQEFEAAARP